MKHLKTYEENKVYKKYIIANKKIFEFAQRIRNIKKPVIFLVPLYRYRKGKLIEINDDASYHYYEEKLNIDYQTDNLDDALKEFEMIHTANKYNL